MNVALVCIAKNEDDYIDEWINYHIKLGFSKIIIYQNDWRYFGQFKDSNLIELIEYDGELKQISAYNHFIEQYYKDYDWAAFIDVDEFIVLKQDNDISGFLEKYNDYSSLGLNWNMFGSNGLKFDGEYSVLKRFLKCHQILIEEIKCLINFNKSGKTLEFGLNNPHNISKINTTINVEKTNYINGPLNKNNLNNREIAYINHYYTKTKEEWDKKIARGWPIQSTKTKNYTDSLFERRNQPEYNEYEDLTAYNFYFK
jgi:hypothetical protein